MVTAIAIGMGASTPGSTSSCVATKESMMRSPTTTLSPAMPATVGGSRVALGIQGAGRPAAAILCGRALPGSGRQRLSILADQHVSVCHVRDFNRLVGADVGVGHVGGLEDVLVYKIVVALSGDAFDDRSEDDEAVVAVGELRTGLKVEMCLDNLLHRAGDCAGRFRGRVTSVT